MNIPVLLPSAMAAHLPCGDHRQPVEEAQDGQWIIAGRHSLSVVTVQGVVQSAMWYEVQRAKWDAQTKILTIFWANPAREPLTVQTVGSDPKRFMEAMAARVEHALVNQMTVVANNGTAVTASVRRGADNRLFSMVVADGPTDHDVLALAHALESEVRETVGLPPCPGA